MAAGAFFVLVAGLVLVVLLILAMDKSVGVALGAFSPFFLVGLVLFAAGAMIDTELIKSFLTWGPLRMGGHS